MKQNQRDNIKKKNSNHKKFNITSALSELESLIGMLYKLQSQEKIFNLLRDNLPKIIPFDTAFIALLNNNNIEYILYSISSIADATGLHQKYFSVDEGYVGYVLKNGDNLITSIDNKHYFSHSIEGILKQFGIESVAIIPVGNPDQIKGALYFGSIHSNVYNQKILIVTKLLSQFLNNVFQYNSIISGFEKRWNQIDVLNKVTHKITSRLNLKELLNSATATIQKNLGYFDVTIFLLSEKKDEALLMAHSGAFSDEDLQGFRLPLGKGIVGWVAQHGVSIIANDVSKDPRYFSFPPYRTNSELAVPIKIENEVIGVLNVEDTKLNSFDENDVIVLQTLSDQLGIAIKNARLYDEILQANAHLTDLDRMKSDFMGIVSHDFRSPLSSMILAAKSLLRDETIKQNKKFKTYLQLILDQSNRLSRLAEDMLSITRLESGQLKLEYKIVNVGRLIQDAISLVKASPLHPIETHIEPNVQFIKGDQAKLRQVLQNLINNAIKYSPKGGKIKIEVNDLPPDDIIMSISDQGIGIPKEYITKLFEKFSRVDVGESRKISGTGLGLWICKEIINGHGGRIWVESEEGKGSTFRFTLKKTPAPDIKMP